MVSEITTLLKGLGFTLTVLAVGTGLSFAQGSAPKSRVPQPFWTPLNNQPNFSARLTLLLTDGRLIVQENSGSTWHIFTPDSTGSYVNGTWGATSTLPVINGEQYAPLYYASAVLSNGKVIIQGGEYNNGVEDFSNNRGAIYDPVANTWTATTPPTNGSGAADAGSVVFPNTEWMVQNISNTQSAVLNPSTLNWFYVTGHGKLDRNDEEGWTLLPDGSVLTVDAEASPNAERFIPYQWISAGTIPVQLEDPISQEIGPAVLMYNGTVFATGACVSLGGSGTECQTTGHTAVYTPPNTQMGTGSWVAGPDFPFVDEGVDIADGPASILPNGNVLVFASQGIFLTGGEFFEFDGTSLNAAPNTPNGPNDSSYYGSMLALPTGQIWFTDGSGDIELYTTTGTYQSSWQPTISSVPTTLKRGGNNYKLVGTQLNGLSQGAAYGDDEQMATNYPLIRISNMETGHVFYCKTRNFSTMGVATGPTPVSTYFQVPSSMDTGPSQLVVVANGIPSAPVSVTVQ